MNRNVSREANQFVGTTSWLVPGTYYENARLVAQLVDFVELLVYRWDEPTQELLSAEIERLRSLSHRYGLRYTVHLPTDSFDEVLEVVEFFDSKLGVLNYVIHPYDDERFAKFVKAHKNIAVENLAEKFYVHDQTVFDVGHHLTGMRVDGKFLENVVELHLMGVRDGEDHLELDETTLERVWEVLGEKVFEIPLVCFEIFDLEQLINSVVLWERWGRRRASGC